MLRSQLQPFFPEREDRAPFAEFGEDTAEDKEDIPVPSKAQSSGPLGGGVWVRKPRSSRKGSGGE